MKTIFLLTKITLYVLILGTFHTQLLSQTEVTLTNGKKLILNDDGTYKFIEEFNNKYDFTNLTDDQIPSFLRQGISAHKDTIRKAIEMYEQGWRYTMPKPKSPQAMWGNSDGRTTWWYGYWHNIETNKYSDEIPEKNASGIYYGDDQNFSNYYRRGGSPPPPSKIQWLLSSSGGVKPK